MKPIDRCRPGQTPAAPARLFTRNEDWAVRVGEMDLERERARRRRFLGRYFAQPRNRLANRGLEALRALVVDAGVAGDDDMVEAACVSARDAGVRETQIAYVVERHRLSRCRR